MGVGETAELTPTLIRAARALLGFDQGQLAEKVGISRKTIALIETMKESPVDPRRRAILEKLRNAMETDLHVEFVFASTETGEGVRLRRPAPAKAETN
ncbi:helix-turn-helix domain-containing protein [Bradyrhizobium sp. 44]|uniref:helix-turn-helix transcriptional regulator n=1 Tax=Bradyrhizobium sp. 44 TaxID=2782675 RepID=UPI001FFB64A2